MKIALQLAANPRSFKRCYESFVHNILEPLNPDIFIHTWRLNGNERPDVITDGTCEEYVELYKPKKFIIDDLTYNYEPLNTMVPHFTSRHRVNQIRQNYEKINNLKYDIVIMARPDVRLINPIISDNYSQVLGSRFEMDYIKLVKEDSIWIHHFKDGLPADYMYYTTPKWMDIGIEGCYNNMDKLNIYSPGAERLWWHILQQNNFQRDQFKYYGNSIHDEDHKINSYKLFDIECVR
jgi:hypothetical protein